MLKSGLPMFECEDGYPTDESLDGLRSHVFDPRTAALFLVHDLEVIKNAGISCMSVDVEDGQNKYGRSPIKKISYHTGGWSGAENLIEAMLGHFWIRHFHTKWERGGHYYFEVPKQMLTLQAPSPENAAVACEQGLMTESVPSAEIGKNQK